MEMVKMTRHFSALVLLLALAVTARGHDTWVQTNVNVVRPGDSVHVDLMLGNHGNDHRDFKLASKVDPAAASLTVVAPSFQIVRSAKRQPSAQLQRSGRAL